MTLDLNRCLSWKIERSRVAADVRGALLVHCDPRSDVVSGAAEKRGINQTRAVRQKLGGESL